MPTKSSHARGADIFARRPVIPVLTLDDAKQAIALARALAAGGLDVLEVTLRTPTALEAIRAIAQDLPEVIVGAGTVLDAAQMREVERAGAKFLVSPGHSDRLLAAADECALPWLLGAATASEVQTLRERGHNILKFFPAEPMGGVATLKALQPVFPDVAFCPTGGIDAIKAKDYLQLANVIAVGGSWIAPSSLLAKSDFSAITRLAAEGANMDRTFRALSSARDR
jgi:2-dehydro-3-deoxyphosphogluconate aldolase/(4S)-4-hydroxy-2-oxoglutarate aldolase